MRGFAAIGAACLAVQLAACAPQPAAPVNSSAYAVRSPLPGRPGYLETIKYIGDGLRYTAAGTGFLVDAKGDMCFSGPANVKLNRPINFQNFWCINPHNVELVEALNNDVTHVNQVRLWCRHSTPQCAYMVAYPNMLDDIWIADSITAEIIPSTPEQAAIAYLIYLMGGNASAPGLPSSGTYAALDTPPAAASVRPPIRQTEETR
ncbi:MAG TPA: hypothetical protein VGF34_12090 [Stellaceae bacterium]|jgi:hypothetical protein